MDASLEEKLREKYPKILRDMGGNPKQTCMAWGIECDNGWFDLLDKTMEKIQYICDLTVSSPTPTEFVATQIKEKFGTLCLYYSLSGSGSGDRLTAAIVEDIVNTAARKSSSICEVSGKHGTPCHRGGWLKTLSREEAARLGYEARDPKMQEFWNSKTKIQ
jgi:hypothetical protein